MMWKDGLKYTLNEFQQQGYWLVKSVYVGSIPMNASCRLAKWLRIEIIKMM